MLKPIQAVIVDLDGTMVDTLGDFEEALNRTLADLDLSPGVDARAGRAHRGQGLGAPDPLGAGPPAGPAQGRRACPTCCSARNVDTLYEPAWQRYQHHYRRINGQFSPVYPGVVEGLAALKAKGLPMACLTNKPLSFAQGLLAVKGAGRLFRVGVRWRQLRTQESPTRCRC